MCHMSRWPCFLFLFIPLVAAESLYAFVEGQWTPVSNSALRNQNYTDGYIQQILNNPTSNNLFVAGSFHLYFPLDMRVDLASVNLAQDGWSPWPHIDLPPYGVAGVNALVLNGSTLYIGGKFQVRVCGDSSNTDPCNSVLAVLNATTPRRTSDPDGFHATQSLQTASLDGEVQCLGLLGQYLFVGGVFTMQTAGATFENFLVWDAGMGAWDSDLSGAFRDGMFAGTVPTAFAQRTLSSGSTWLYVALYFPDGSTRLYYTQDSVISWTYMTNSHTFGQITSMLFWNVGSPSAFGDMYVAGRFTHIGTTTNATCIARATFTNSTAVAAWRALPKVHFGVTVLPYVWSMVPNDTTLVLSGLFYHHECPDCNSVITYDPVTNAYAPLSTGFYGMVKTLAFLDDVLYAGVWEFSHPVGTASGFTAVIALAALLLCVLFSVAVYFMATKFLCQPSKVLHIKVHNRARRFLSSLIMLISLAVVLSANSKIGSRFFLSQLFPGQSILRAESLSNIGILIQVVVGFVSAPFAGYAANRFDTRRLVTIGLVLGVINHLTYAFARTAGAVYFSYVCAGLSTGIVFPVCVLFYCRNAAFNFVVGSLLALYSTSTILVAFLNSLTYLAFQFGLLRPDFIWHGVFEVILEGILILLLWSDAFAEEQIEDRHNLLSLRQQFRIRWPPSLLLLFGYMFLWVAQYLLRDMALVFVHTVGEQAILNLGFFGTAIGLLILFYILSWRGASLRSQAVMLMMVILISFSILIASLFTLPPSTVIPVGWQSYAFLTGALIAPAAINVLFAISASVYVGLLTQTSRGTMIGVFVAVGMVSQLISLGISSRVVLAPINQGIVAVILGCALLLLIIIFVALYGRMRPVMVNPFAAVSVGSVNLQEMLLRRSGASLPIPHLMSSPSQGSLSLASPYTANQYVHKHVMKSIDRVSNVGLDDLD